MKNNKFIVLLVVIAILFLNFTVSNNLYIENQKRISPDYYLYIPTGKYLRLFSLGHEELFGDFLLSRALIYFGSHYYKRKTFRYPNLYEFFDSVTELDSHNEEAYLMGARLLSTFYPQKSIKLLEKGMKNIPSSWRLPELAGYISYFELKNKKLSAKFYEIASKKPERPPYVPSLSSKFYREAGDIESAINVLKAFYETVKDKRLKEGFKSDIEALEDELDFLKRAKKGKVVKIYDGDTFLVKLKNKKIYKVRLLGVNTFELDDKDYKKRLFAYIAKDYLYYKIYGKIVKVSPGGDIVDNYGRLLSYVWYGKNNKFLNYELVLKGYAKAFLKYEFERSFMKRLSVAEKLAKINLRGYWGWGKASPVDYRFSKNLVGYPAKVRFKVFKVFKKRKYVLVESSADWKNDFKLFIPIWAYNQMKNFVDGLYGKTIIASGFVSEYKNSPEMRIYFKEQIKVER